jgi:hypothetical protein
MRSGRLQNPDAALQRRCVQTSKRGMYYMAWHEAVLSICGMIPIFALTKSFEILPRGPRLLSRGHRLKESPSTLLCDTILPFTAAKHSIKIYNCRHSGAVPCTITSQGTRPCRAQLKVRDASNRLRGKAPGDRHPGWGMSANRHAKACAVESTAETEGGPYT